MRDEYYIQVLGVSISASDTDVQLVLALTNKSYGQSRFIQAPFQAPFPLTLNQFEPPESRGSVGTEISSFLSLTFTLVIRIQVGGWNCNRDAIQSIRNGELGRPLF